MVKRKLFYDGIEIDPNLETLKKYCFLVSKKYNKRRRTYEIYFKLNLGNTATNIIEESHELVSSGNTYVSDSSTNLGQSSNGIVTLRLFPNQSIGGNLSSSQLKGTFVLNNGKTMEYNVGLHSKSLTTKSCGKVFDTDTTPPVGTPVSKELYGVGKIGVADFRKVEQEVCCYVPGQVSHIENVMAKEYKERATRNLVSIETTREDTTETEVENLTDSTTTERNEMQTEVSSVLNADKSTAFGASTGVSGSYGGMNFSADAYADTANSSSSSQSNSTAQTYAQEVTDRVLERIVQKTSSKRTSRVLKEFEENNKHGFDNRDGVQHVSGVYRWIDIIYKNQLVNYGKRLMYEFMVPEPSRFFKEAILKEADNSSGMITLSEPIHPADLLGTLKMSSPNDLDKFNYQRIAGAYRAEVNSKPSQNVLIGKSFSINGTKDDTAFERGVKNGEIIIPEGYVSKHGKVNYSAGEDDTVGSAKFVSVHVGDKSFINAANMIKFHNETSYMITGSYVEKIPVSFLIVDYFVGNLNVSVKCELTQKATRKWQTETFNTIMNAYNDRVAEYNEAKLAAGIGVDKSSEKIRFNPLFNQAIMKRELKRICIGMLAKPYGNPQDENHYSVDEDGIPKLNQTAEFENHAAHVKFFEQAFDWEIMAYLFYPYYWAARKDWKTLFKENEPADPIFQAFLQSGMSRAVVPVRPGFEDAVTYYMETGDIWNGGDLVLDNEDDLYISIAEEMQVIEGEVEDEWETRVPTSLTMIQKDTVGLNETGLPCCDFVLNNESGIDYINPIEKSEALIGGPVVNPTDVGAGDTTRSK